MKTLKPGDLELAKPWYLRAMFRCGYCRGEFRAETEDEVTVHDDPRETWAEIACPTCGKRIARGQG